jgi:hypothetical protein
MGRSGSALLLTLVAIISIGLALVLYHHQALRTLGLAHAALASARAREGAAIGLVTAATGAGITGAGPGAMTWQVQEDTLPGGGRILWSDGRAGLPARASLRLVAILAPPDTSAGSPPLFLRRWVALRY